MAIVFESVRVYESELIFDVSGVLNLKTLIPYLTEEVNSIEFEYSFNRNSDEVPTGGHGDNISYSDCWSYDDLEVTKITIGEIIIDETDLIESIIALINEQCENEDQKDINHLLENFGEYDEYEPEPDEPDFFED